MTAKLESIIHHYLNNYKLRVYLFAFFFIAIFLLILWMNVKTPAMGDDITYQYIFNTGEKVENVEDIVVSQQNHYHVWGGRIVVHTIAQLLLFIDPLVADFLNTIAFLSLIILIYLHINYKKPFSVSLFVGIFLLLWFLEPFGETVIWMTGSANYMWGTVIILAFLLPYRIYRGKPKGIFQIVLYSLLIFLAGILAGWTNENTAAGMILIIVLFLVYYKKSESLKIPFWAYAGLAGAVIGYIIMIAAPGNAVRAHETETSVFLIFYRLFRHTQALLNHVGLLNLAYIILFVLLVRQNKNNGRRILSKSLIYQLGMLAAVYVMLFSPSFPERAWFGAIVFNITGIGILMVNIDVPSVKYIRYGLVSLGLLILAFNLFDVYKDLSLVEHTVKEREYRVEQAVKGGGKEVVFSRYHLRTKYAVEDPVYSAQMLSVLFDVNVRYGDTESMPVEK